MKRNILTKVLSLFTIFAMTFNVAFAVNETITICHVPEGNEGNPQTLTISINAWENAHNSGTGQHSNDYEEPCEGDDQSEDVCDSQTFVSAGGENGAVAVTPHANWTTINGAEWVWTENPISDATIDDTQIFTITFNIDGSPSDSELQISADNQYKLTVNGSTVLHDDLGEGDTGNYSSVDSYTILAEDLVTGENTIEIEVLNIGIEGATPESNPAGVIYKLEVNCTPSEPVEPVCIEGNLISNGGFENPTVTNGSGWQLFPDGTSGLDWNVEWRNPSENAPEDANLELHRGVNGWLPFEGNQYAELDTDYGNPAGGEASVTISQSIDTVPGVEYTLSYYFSPRPNTFEEDNVLRVYVGEEDMHTQGPFAGGTANDWNLYTYNFTATDETTEISFQDAGNSDSRGTFLDNVAVRCDGENPTDPGDEDTFVKLCKVDEEGVPLPGWELSLNKYLETVTVYPNGNTYSSDSYGAGDYKLVANGTYEYRGSSGLLADAAFSERRAEDLVDLQLDPVNYTYAPWYQSNSYNSVTESIGGLGIWVNENGPVWGTVFNPSHEYSYEVEGFAGGEFDFKITDNLYEDNVGSLTVKIYSTELSGTTDEEGCITFENVPFGEYEVSEIMQNGWVNISGLGIVEVDEDEEVFVVMNAYEGSQEEDDQDEGDDENEGEEDEEETDTQEGDNDPEPTPQRRSSSSGSRISGGGAVLGASTGEVLGACVPFDMYHKKGDIGGEVAKIQEFLNEHMKAGLTVDGVYNEATVKAVKDFQNKYFDHVIKPWVPFFKPQPTGKWYKTTRMMANKIIDCPEAPVYLEDPKIMYEIKWEKPAAN